MLLGPPADLSNKPPAKTSTAVIGVNIDLAQVGCVRFEHLDMCKPNRSIASESNPEMPSTLGILQVLLTRGLVENRIRGMTSKKFGGGEFYGSDQMQVANSSVDNFVNRHDGLVPSS